MKRLRDLLVDGLLLAIPLALLAVLLAQVVKLVASVSAPLAARFPQYKLLGVALSELLIVASLVVVVLVVGLFVRSRMGKATREIIERVVLRKVPGFLLFKAVASGFANVRSEGANLVPVLVDFDDNTVLAFLIEEAAAPGGLVTVFVPSSPTPAAGQVVLVEPKRVRRLDKPMGAAMRTITNLGVGTQALIAGEK